MRTKTIWDIEFDRQVSSASLVGFTRRKKALLDHLNKKRAPNSKPLDEEQSWRALSHLAQLYFWEEKIKKETRPASDHIDRLHDLAKALGKTRRMIEKAMQGDLGHDLFRACLPRDKSRASVFSLAWVPPDDDSEIVDWGHLEDTIEKVSAGLTTLEAAALRAAEDMRTLGRPKGSSVLPGGYIHALADVYRKSTGHEPRAGGGPFTKFIIEFPSALGRDSITATTVMDAIKNARREWGWL
jgi:hypothetical protein